jgi:hypothetical protein
LGQTAIQELPLRKYGVIQLEQLVDEALQIIHVWVHGKQLPFER